MNVSKWLRSDVRLIGVLAATMILALLAGHLLRRLDRPDPADTELTGTVEDLWGAPMDLSRHRRGTVAIHPFSPAVCGYCLADGDFVRMNYRANITAAGGQFFGLCLRESQLDIYTFLKHYREGLPVINWPVDRSLHSSGFPWMLAFVDGKRVYDGTIWPYERQFRAFGTRVWGDVPPIRPSSPINMATRFAAENMARKALYIVPDGDKAGFAKARERCSKSSHSLSPKYEHELTEQDYTKTLYFDGKAEDFRLAAFEGRKIPVTIAAGSFHVGDFSFPLDTVGVNACFPNPFNPEMYVVWLLRGSKLRSELRENWVDYTIYNDDDGGSPQVLLHGFFDKSGDAWQFSASLAFGSVIADGADQGASSPPAGPEPGGASAEHPIPSESVARAASGEASWMLGDSDCRFPALTVDRQGRAWLTWEQGGDIALAAVGDTGPIGTWFAERGTSDSFNPILSTDGDGVWVFYLSDQDGMYRLYANRFDGKTFSQQRLVGARTACDAITPAVTSNGDGTTIVAWSEWRANYRFLKYRSLQGQQMGELKEIAPKPSETSYTCMWWPALALDDSGAVWAAWNQHYPGPLGVYAGDLVHEPMDVIGADDRNTRNTSGGYPSIVWSPPQSVWVFWESRASSDDPEAGQKILGSRYDVRERRWAPQYCPSDTAPAAFNQTPKAAADPNGTIWLTWSSRDPQNSHWSVVLSHFDGGSWSTARRVSPQGQNARAPAIHVGPQGDRWLAWHAGTGRKMRIQISRHAGKQ